MDTIWTISIILLVVVFVILIISFFVYLKAFKVTKKQKEQKYTLPLGENHKKYLNEMKNLICELENIEYEEVSIRSHDGLKLFGRNYHIKDGAPLQIQIHGYSGNPVRDFCGGNKLARESRHNTLVIEQRAHGKSEGSVITFGIKERLDCLSWIKYACDRFGDNQKIILAGVSMGAATVLMASELNLPKNVVGIIADSPYNSVFSIITKVGRDMKVPTFISTLFILIASSLYAHFNIFKASPEKAVKNTKIPILLIHGKSDDFVPYQMSEKIYSFNSTLIEKHLFNGAAHGISYMVDKDKYEKITLKFIEKIIK